MRRGGAASGGESEVPNLSLHQVKDVVLPAEGQRNKVVYPRGVCAKPESAPWG